jgi:hypothetical protein
MLSVSDDDVIAELTHDGLPLSAYFLLGAVGRQGIGLWHPNNGVMACAMDNREQALACIKFLRSRGVHEFQTHAEVLETARREQWPNWERFYANSS